MKFLKELRLRFWMRITEYLCSKYYDKRCNIKTLDFMIFCHKKELQAYKSLYGCSALTEN